tara:strand:- start:4877 stop:6133 length:1257 start_codon:yes stop_codon:yes gene_type:complete
MSDFTSLVDLKNKTVHPRVFVDPEIYKAEQEKLFGRCWLFIGHESQVPNQGDYVTTYMGEEPVIFVKDRSDRLRVFLNSCRHRGVKVCRKDHGNTKIFTCPYHGWSYNTEGGLQGVPQIREAYHNDLDKDKWGLIEVPRVESHYGLVFACFDEESQSLTEYLGSFAFYLDLILRRSKGGTVSTPGTHRWRMPGNWKLASEQFAGDNYHADTLHRSPNLIGLGPDEYRGGTPWDTDFEAKCSNGHGWINFHLPSEDIPPVQAEYMKQLEKEAQEVLPPRQAALINGVQVGTIFPNFSILGFLGFTTIRVWHPRGPKEMEVWSWGLIERDAPPEIVEITRKMQCLTFSPSGIFEQDDGCVWGEITDTLSGQNRINYPLNYQMGAGHGKELADKPGLLHPPSTEIGVFGYHEHWREMMGRK